MIDLEGPTGFADADRAGPNDRKVLGLVVAAPAAPKVRGNAYDELLAEQALFLAQGGNAGPPNLVFDETDDWSEEALAAFTAAPN